jgi:hypothetical protein
MYHMKIYVSDYAYFIQDVFFNTEIQLSIVIIHVYSYSLSGIFIY